MNLENIKWKKSIAKCHVICDLKIFFPNLEFFFFTLLTGSFVEQKFFFWWSPVYYIILFVSFWPCSAFIAAWLFPWLQQAGPALQLQCPGFCGAQALEHRLSSRGTGLACGIFPGQGSVPVSSIGRQLLYHWATREPSVLQFFNS